MAPFLRSALRVAARILLVLPLALLVCFAAPVQAAQWTSEQLTVPASPDGALVTFSEQEVKAGRKLFNTSCGTCHAGGITKTNQNVGLDPETLSLATPPRDSVSALVDYLKDPTSYDGEYSIADVHPSLRSSDVFVQMRNLDDEDLRLMAGYILVAPKVQGEKWGGGKIWKPHQAGRGGGAVCLSCLPSSARRGRRGGQGVGGIEGGGLLAVPPLLQRRCQALGEQGDHRARGAGSGLQQFHRIGGAAAGGQIGHEPPADAPPAGFLAAPGQAAAGPGQFLAIEQAAAGPEDAIAVLTAGTGMLAAAGQHGVHLVGHQKATPGGGVKRMDPRPAMTGRAETRADRAADRSEVQRSGAQ
jgi:photosystem II cytochrome c550